MSIVRNEGVGALFRGALPRALWVAPVGAMNFAGQQLIPLARKYPPSLMSRDNSPLVFSVSSDACLHWPFLLLERVIPMHVAGYELAKRALAGPDAAAAAGGGGDGGASGGGAGPNGSGAARQNGQAEQQGELVAAGA